MKWITKIKTGALKSETDNYDNFKENLLVRVLGYDRDEVQISAAKPGREPDFIVGGKTGMDLCKRPRGRMQTCLGISTDLNKNMKRQCFRLRFTKVQIQERVLYKLS